MTDPTTAAVEAVAFHPSEFIQAELEARGWTLDGLALRMGGPKNWAVNRLALDMYFEVGPREPDLVMGEGVARDMARAFGVSPQFLLNLEAAWRASRAKH